ncbi:MAG: hypothetical protein BWY14_00757 [Parcubacteria group bacterium ADurb.Bin192]|nr:MAG: hypothetical protein BWY14_00757 [Parcubacteria group bacterium ADurb.Bin192]
MYRVKTNIVIASESDEHATAFANAVAWQSAKVHNNQYNNNQLTKIWMINYPYWIPAFAGMTG